MKNIFKFLLVTFVIALIAGCNPFESTFDKQVKSCREAVKLGLNDPESMEIVSTEGFDVENGWYRVELNFTAKNAMGGRVRGNTICGFISKDATELNPEDFMNQKRKLARDMKSLGIN